MLRRKYGLTIEQFDEMVLRQGGKCAICRDVLVSDNRKTHVDHDHATNTVRGILCHHCNVGIGHFRESPTRLLAAIGYLAAPPHRNQE